MRFQRESRLRCCLGLFVVGALSVFIPMQTERRSHEEWRKSLFDTDPFERQMTAAALREAPDSALELALWGLSILHRDRDLRVQASAEAALIEMAHRVVALREQGAGEGVLRIGAALHELGLPAVDAALGVPGRS